MSRQLIINASASEEIRVAIVENERLLDLDIENQARTKHKGNIYKGIVANVEDSLEAAFIEFGDDKQAFLALSEVRPALYPAELKGQRRPRISEVLRRGQEIVVQVIKDEIGNKGAAVTTYLSLPGRYVVLMHSDEAGGGVSRKVDDEAARRRARQILSHIEVPDGMAVIIRTAGVTRPRLDLYRDLKSLARQWEQIDRGAQLGRAPTLLYREPDLVVRTIRDYLSPEIGKIVIDAEEEFEELKSYFETVSPESADLLELHTSKQPVFEKYGIESEIEDLFERQVPLPSGGYLVVDQAEALVAIDVNSGRSTKESDHEATVYKTNLEAAREVARQLRLRDMGGIIVVDFIDMANRKHDRDVERALRDAMKDDKARVKIGRISENGTLEITRQRLRQAHRLVSHTPCPHCAGTGIVRDPRGLAISALRQLSARVSRSAGQFARVTMRLPVDVANIIQNTKRRELLELGDEHQMLIDVVGDPRLQGKEFKFDEERRGKAGLDAANAVRDPRLSERDHGRRGKRGRREEPTSSFGPTVPPPSIGPTPVFRDDEAAILAADARDADDERLAAERVAAGVEADQEHAAAPEPRPTPERAAAEAPLPEHFDDPLSEALFGTAPTIPVAQAESEPPPPVEGPIAEGGEGRRRRRRRRRRRGRGGADGGPNGGADAANGGNEGDEGEEGDEGDEQDTVQTAPVDSAVSIGAPTPAPTATSATDQPGSTTTASLPPEVAPPAETPAVAVVAEVVAEVAAEAASEDATDDAPAGEADEGPRRRRRRSGGRRKAAADSSAEPAAEGPVADDNKT